ncbi:hypothetical protein DAI22_10g043601 [Oryza sativa Japonica Group]|nr:hypothetical protein DAI22_10g043601 [Oryza sativa Japonica Group]
MLILAEQSSSAGGGCRYIALPECVVDQRSSCRCRQAIPDLEGLTGAIENIAELPASITTKYPTSRKISITPSHVRASSRFLTGGRRSSRGRHLAVPDRGPIITTRRCRLWPWSLAPSTPA